MTSKYEGHTKGPWESRKIDKRVTGVWGGGYRVAECIAPNHSADAALIAAAPRLLAERDALVEALRHAAAALESLAESAPNEFLQFAHLNAAEDARSALAQLDEAKQ